MTRVALLWHMHQPFYQDLATGEHILPWVRLHALKDYWGMAALMREFPGLKLTFNLVPSLLVQLEAFANGQARDRHLTAGLTPAEALSDADRQFCVEQFFHAHRARMIDPYPRYAELLALREAGRRRGDPAGAFTVEDLRDLQVWHKLAWVDPFYLDGDDRIRALVAKGRGFSEADKDLLRSVELEILNRAIAEYRAAAGRGQAELSTSPFYHPILPLLCDAGVYLQTHPGWPPPEQPFAHPDDASEQLRRAVDLHERLFGEPPQGLWPSEGSVSDAMVPLVADAGFAWMATDEEILARTLTRSFSRDAELYRPYSVGRDGHSVACAFRDHALSDLIGFAYSSWDASAAADDFVARLVGAGERYRTQRGGEEATVFVVLDGENAWEHYEGQGRPFLRALYARLERDPRLQTVTMAEACATASERLPSIVPGSWINGDFYIWIGHADDRRAWGQLARARRAWEHAPAGLSRAALAAAREELLIAEGSDWYWWYGDDHSSDHDPEFDDLFRRHVRNVYRALDLPIPEDLFVTNISTLPAQATLVPPSGLIEPVIDGVVSSYFEWLGAGELTAPAVAGTMHQVAALGQHISVVRFGFGVDSLYLQVVTTESLVQSLGHGGEVTIAFLRPAGVRISLRMVQGTFAVQTATRGPDGRWVDRAFPLEAVVQAVAEVRIPLDHLGVRDGDEIGLVVALRRAAQDADESTVTLEATVPGRRPPGRSWRT